MNEIETKSIAEMYGTFYLNSNEFALAVRNIQEVVNSPEKLMTMPLAPDYLIGIFNLRGLIVPVVDLKIILNLEKDSDPLRNKKITIVEYDGIKVGLLFDKTGHIFRNQHIEKSDFHYEKSQQHENVVSGAIKIDEGRSIIQILDAKALVKLEKVPHSQDGNFSHSKTSQMKNQGLRKQCISFSAGDNHFGLGIDAIHEIIKISKLSETSLNFGISIGVVELRGDTIPVIDFAALLKYRDPQNKDFISEDQRIIIIKFGNDKIGFLIDSVESIMTYYTHELLFIPILGKEKSLMFSGCLTKQDGSGEVMLLKHDEILSKSELAEIKQGHSKLYQSSHYNGLENQKKGIKKTYITFKIDNLFALEMIEVREIIEYPDKLIHPPGMPSFINGMLNLRGKMITIIDARVLYSMKSKTSFKDSKILIFDKNGVHYGLVVDSVENIVSFSEEEQIKLPKVLYKSDSKNVSEDVKYAVEIDINSEKKCVLVLNLEPLAAKTGLFSIGPDVRNVV